MSYRLIIAIFAGLIACGVSSCNKPVENARKPGAKGIYETPIQTGDLAQESSSLVGDDVVREQSSSEGLGIIPTIHTSALEAWNLVETSYIVVETRWRESEDMITSGNMGLIEQGKELRQTVNAEIDTNIFEVNETVEDLFKDAIAKDPENLNNLATYALYLKPRRRTVDTGLMTTDIEAFELLDQAIERDPENPIWYLLKIHSKTSPNICHNWIREYAEERLAIQRWLPEIDQLFDQVEGLAPDNGFINYYNAILTSKFAIYDPQFPERAEIMREIRAGNKKETVNFFFPPPLPPFADVYWSPNLKAKNPSAVFIDHWNQFSMHDARDVDTLVTRMAASLSWPEDKDEIGELMLFLYQLGRTQPYDRSFFGLQLKLLQPFAEQVEPGSDEALKLANALRYLNDQYHTVANELYSDNMIIDSAKVGVIGIHEAEISYSHRLGLAGLLQRHQMRYLEKAGEYLGIEFELFEQPNI